VAFVIGAQVWSMSSFRGDSNAAAKSTNVTEFSVILHNCSFSRGNASTITTSGAKLYFLKHPLLARAHSKVVFRHRQLAPGVVVIRQQCEKFSTAHAAFNDPTLWQAFGGGVAIVVGAFLFNSNGPLSDPPKTTFGVTFVQHSHVALIHVHFSDCSVSSFTRGAASGSLGSSSIYGGAFALIQSLQVNVFREGLLSTQNLINSTGFNLTVIIFKSNFSGCAALTDSKSVRPGTSNGGGGSVYASGAALSNISVSESHFSSSSVHVASGATGAPSNSSGGALAVDVPCSIDSVVVISSCIFFNCSARGANMINMAVRGGAVAVSGVAAVSVVKSVFMYCSITNSGDLSGRGSGAVVVSGGAGLSVALARRTSVSACTFDAADGRDDSRTSSGLLVLANRSSDIVHVLSTKFVSSVVVFSVLCISSDGLESFAGKCYGPILRFNDSHLQSLAVANQNTLITLQSQALFSRSRMVCASGFAVFKTNSADNSVAYNCSFCPTYFISVSATEVLIDRLFNASNVDRCVISSSTSTSVSSCPFGVALCTTFVNVTTGFWTNFTQSGSLERARRCPRGYCGCIDASNGTCQLTPLLSIGRSNDPLCTGNRTGRLCGGCPPDFTQSMDGVSCISNQDCANDMWWVWTVSILGFACVSYLIIPRAEHSSGVLACIMFYLQMSSFATSLDDSNTSNAIFEFGLVHSLAAVYTRACYAPNMSAYSATAAKLIGSLFVLLFSVAWTWIILSFQPLLRRRNIDIQVSYSGTLISAVLYVFSSVAGVLFTLIECTNYSHSGVVFIDGTVACLNIQWQIALSMVVILCLFPVLFAAALWRRKLPARARAAVGRAYIDDVPYWSAFTLVFRLLIPLLQFLREGHPNMLAFLRCLLSMLMLVLLVNFRPYKNVNTFWVDVASYTGLIVQFGIQSILESPDYFGINASEVGLDEIQQKQFFQSLSTLSSIFRYVYTCASPLFTSSHADDWRSIDLLLSYFLPSHG
jgi:hypothetical protein